eukprot:9190105-Alexandrium_andersonii.AAC.1
MPSQQAMPWPKGRGEVGSIRVNSGASGDLLQPTLGRGPFRTHDCLATRSAGHSKAGRRCRGPARAESGVSRDLA